MQFSNFKSIKLSKIGFGCASLSGSGKGYGFGDISDRDASKLVHEAIDLGINLFDNAPIYGFGEAERRLGLAIESRRSDAFIVSKCGVNWHENSRVNMTNEPELCLSQLHNSLRRLKSDYIDLYMVHWPDKRVEIEKTLEVLFRAKKEGKIRFIGLCNTNPEDLGSALSMGEIDCLQSEFNLFNNGFDIIDETIKNSKKDKLYKMAWGTFDKGILTGSVKTDSVFDKEDCRNHAPWWKKSDWKKRVIRFDKALSYLRENNIDPAKFCMAYNLQFMDSTLCGFKSSKHLESVKDISLDPIHFENVLRLVDV